MNLSEFKAWFEGFTEDMDGAPNDKQWKRVKKRVGEIDSEPTPYPVYIDRYYQPYRQWWTTPIQPWVMMCNNAVQNVQQSFTATGRAEAAQIAAN